MAEKAKVKHDLHEEDVKITNLLLNRENLIFPERRKALVDLINGMLVKARGNQEGPVHLLPEVEVPKDYTVSTRQSLTGETPHPHHSFRT